MNWNSKTVLICVWQLGFALIKDLLFNSELWPKSVGTTRKMAYTGAYFADTQNKHSVVLNAGITRR